VFDIALVLVKENKIEILTKKKKKKTEEQTPELQTHNPRWKKNHEKPFKLPNQKKIRKKFV